MDANTGMPAIERLWMKVDRNGPAPVRRPDLGPCWLFTGSLNNYGYGRLAAGGKPFRLVFAHRVAYEDVYGALKEDMTIDHLCRTRNCIRVTHLEAVSHGENMRRGALFRKQEALVSTS